MVFSFSCVCCGCEDAPVDICISQWPKKKSNALKKKMKSLIKEFNFFISGGGGSDESLVQKESNAM